MNNKELDKLNQSLVKQGQEFSVTTQEQHDQAGDFLKALIDAQKKIIDYWKDTKTSAKESLKKICEKEKNMLTPLKEAEKNVRSKMSLWVTLEKEKRRIEQEKIEKEKKELVNKYKNSENEEEKAMAEIIENTEISVNTEISKGQGISYQTTYEVEIENNDKVPVSINGIEIRPVDLSVIKKLAIQSKSKLKIDGIKITEKQIVRCKV